jgi:protein-disulfide isomerase
MAGFSPNLVEGVSMSKREEIRQKRGKEKQRRLLIWILIIGGIAVVIAAAVVYRTQSLVRSITTPEFLQYENADGTALGNPDAPIRIEEFSDFQCPACQFFHDETLEQLIDEFVKTGQVYLVYHQFPVIDSRSAIKESENAALASLCAAEQNLFWEYHDILFANQIGENAGGFSEARLLAFGDILDLDRAEFKECVQNDRYRAQLAEDMQKGLAYGINSTPSFVINGEVARGAIPIENFRTIIGSILSGSE